MSIYFLPIQDAIPDEEGDLSAIPTRGEFVAYEYNWNPRVYSS